MSTQTCLACQSPILISPLRGRCITCFENVLPIIEASLTSWKILEDSGFASVNRSNGIKRLLAFAGQSGIAYCQICDWKVSASKGNDLEEKEKFLDRMTQDHLRAMHDYLIIDKEVYKLGKNSKKMARLVYRG